MSDWRSKIAVLVVVLGLGGLGGYAMSSNRKATQTATTTSAPATKVIRRTIHKKPKHRHAAGTPGAVSRSLTSAPVSTGSSGSSSSTPVSTGSSGSGGGGAVSTGTSGSGGGGESEGGGEHEGCGEGGD